MSWWSKKKTQTFIAGLFFSVLVFQGAAVSLHSVHAQNAQVQAQVGANTNAASQGGGEKKETGGWYSGIVDGSKWIITWLLAQVRKVIYSVIATPAAAAFVWVVNPANISGPTGVLNYPAVYSLWQFIRDFFNLFFILILLFSAFATIFQVDSFNIRNIFKNVILVALLINFSFPITRFLIDAANVPMYYFINDVIGAGTGQGGTRAMNNLLGHSGVSSGIFATVGENDDLTSLAMAIIFTFLFGVSLAVLSVMMIVRLIALTLLLIFSPLGFAGALLPGLNKYGQEWWSKFWNYALFGPAAALMLVVSLRFLEASSPAFQSMQMAATNVTVTKAGAITVAQIIFYTFPIILIWSTIGMASKFSIAGAATVVSAGYGFSSWTRKKLQKGVVFVGKKTVNNPVTRGVGSGIAQRFNDNKIVKYVKSPSKTEARIRGAVGTGTVKGELDKLHEQQVKKDLDELKKNKTSYSEAQAGMTSGGQASRQANAMYLAQNDDIRNASDFRDGLAAMAGNAEFTSEFVKKSQGAIDNVTDLATALNALGTDSKTAAAVIDKINPGALAATDAEYTSLLASPALTSPASQKQLQGRMKKEGRISPVIDHEVRTTGASMASVVDRHLDGMTVEEIAKQDSLLRSNPDAHGYVLGLRASDPAKYQEIKNKMKSGTSALFP